MPLSTKIGLTRPFSEGAVSLPVTICEITVVVLGLADVSSVRNVKRVNWIGCNTYVLRITIIIPEWSDLSRDLI